MKIVNPEYTVERIVERMREASLASPSANVYLDNSGTASSENSEVEASYSIHPISFQPPFHPQDEYHVADLLQYADEQFVENAYRAILKRSPDAVGREALLNALRSGDLNKIDILARLRYSNEGRAESVPIRGLLVPAALRKLYRVPIAGYLLNLFVAVLRLPSIIRSSRQFEAHMLAHEEIMVRQVNHIGNSLMTHETVLGRVEELTRYLEDRINDESVERRNIQSRQNEQTRELRELITKLGTDFGSQLADYRQSAHRVSAELALQSQQLKQLVERAQSIHTGTVSVQSSPEPHINLLDAFYASFDEKFRGDRDAIKQRLKVYLPFISNDGTTIDLGCGRGEWLELLRDVEINATGVELNSVLVKECRDRRLNVVEQDLFAYLSTLPDESVSTVSAFHVVEHLSIENLVVLLNEALRVLKPGGVLLLETPNPRNVLVGTCNFYFDPTHRNPIPSEVLALLVETRGFDQVEVLPLNPSEDAPVAGDSEIVQRFNKYFYGPMDYGLVARRP